MKTVLITGATGNVGSQLRSEFAGRYKLRLSDKRLLRPSAGETFVQADIVELADVLTISEGTDTIVHLGGYASEGPWEMILQADDRGRPVAFALTPGNVADITMAIPLLGAVDNPKRLLADRAYDADSFRHWLKRRKIKAVIPSTATRRTPYPLEAILEALVK